MSHRNEKPDREAMYQEFRKRVIADIESGLPELFDEFWNAKIGESTRITDAEVSLDLKDELIVEETGKLQIEGDLDDIRLEPSKTVEPVVPQKWLPTTIDEVRERLLQVAAEGGGRVNQAAQALVDIAMGPAKKTLGITRNAPMKEVCSCVADFLESSLTDSGDYPVSERLKDIRLFLEDRHLYAVCHPAGEYLKDHDQPDPEIGAEITTEVVDAEVGLPGIVFSSRPCVVEKRGSRSKPHEPGLIRLVAKDDSNLSSLLALFDRVRKLSDKHGIDCQDALRSPELIELWGRLEKLDSNTINRLLRNGTKANWWESLVDDPQSLIVLILRAAQALRATSDCHRADGLIDEVQNDICGDAFPTSWPSNPRALTNVEASSLDEESIRKRHLHQIELDCKNETVQLVEREELAGVASPHVSLVRFGLCEIGSPRRWAIQRAPVLVLDLPPLGEIFWWLQMIVENPSKFSLPSRHQAFLEEFVTKNSWKKISKIGSSNLRNSICALLAGYRKNSEYGSNVEVLKRAIAAAYTALDSCGHSTLPLLEVVLDIGGVELEEIARTVDKTNSKLYFPNVESSKKRRLVPGRAFVIAVGSKGPDGAVIASRVEGHSGIPASAALQSLDLLLTEFKNRQSDHRVTIRKVYNHQAWSEALGDKLDRPYWLRLTDVLDSMLSEKGNKPETQLRDCLKEALRELSDNHGVKEHSINRGYPISQIPHEFVDRIEAVAYDKRDVAADGVLGIKKRVFVDSDGKVVQKGIILKPVFTRESGGRI